MLRRQQFHWLNTKFNGDLFPTETEQASEEAVVSETHLKFLANFIRGDMQFGRGQRFLWPLYSFDVIPLEFISSIYEEFIRNGEKEPDKGVVYTPPHLVDFILDGVLPWDSDEWEVSILDPACGSGIFLVKAYQRLIHRWKAANPRIKPSAGTLRRILERCIFGVDTQDDAVRVASFSLYLAMCDEIDPKRYWTNVRFPRLRGRTINCQDFFDDEPSFVQREGLRQFDLIVGNPPWGQEQELSPAASRWIQRESQQNAEKRSWGTSYVSIGPLFLPRAGELIKPNGTASLMQSSAVLLNDVGTARDFRERFLCEYATEEMVNLSPLRYTLFSNASKATSPPAILTFRRSKPGQDGTATESFTYLCPKPMRTVEDDYRFLVGPHDVHTVRLSDVLSGKNALTTLIWGSRRDIALMSRLSSLPTLQGLKRTGRVISREGIIRGDRKKEQTDILSHPLLETSNFPEGVFLFLDPDKLPNNTDPATDSRASTNFAAFLPPQLIIKQSWIRSNLRFRAARVPSSSEKGVICSQAYVTVHSETNEEHLLDSACLVYNSSFALYWLYLTNHRLASFIAEATVTDLLQLPLPNVSSEGMKSLMNFDFPSVDGWIKKSLGLEETEWTLIDDFFTYTLPDFKQLPDAPGPLPTKRDADDELVRYCDFFLQVLDAAFGSEHRFSATIFREDSIDRLAVRMVAVHLKPTDCNRVMHETIRSPLLAERLRQLEQIVQNARRPGEAGIAYQRAVRVYTDYGKGRTAVPSLYLIKPDQQRYWTASAGMRDADEAFNEIMMWNEGSSRTEGP